MAGIAPPREPTKGVIRIPRPPEGSKIVGQTPDGRNIYEREIIELVRDENGNVQQEPMLGPDKEELWIKHPTTGVPIRKRMRNLTRKRTQRFLIHVEINERGVATGTHSIVEYTEDMEREIERQADRHTAADYRDQLFSAAAKRGISPEKLLDRMFDEGVDDPEELKDVEQTDPEPEPRQRKGQEEIDGVLHWDGEPVTEFPFNKGGPNWMLSDSSNFRGAEDAAVKAEAALHQEVEEEDSEQESLKEL